jgi:hypothetical protein
MANPMAVASAGSKGIFSYIKIFSFMLLFAIIFASAIFQSIDQGSIKPLITEVGGNIVLTTTQLANESQKIINDGGVKTDKTGFGHFWYIIVTYSTFIILLWMTYVWIKLFSKIWEKGPFSYEGNDFANIVMGFLIFMIFQILFGFVYGAMLGNLKSADDAIKVIYTPFYSLYLIFIAFYYIVNPALQPTKEVLEKLPG